VINLKEFEVLLNRNNDSIYVYNFFATWCKPCVKEIPHFVKLSNDSLNSKIKLTFINLDQQENIDDIVVPFLTKKKIIQQVYLLNNTNYALWMPRVDRRWGGSIPATLIINGRNNKRAFIEGEINYKELLELINSTK
jgi:thiol-disulfide isomerase/thioredoxin